MTNFNGKNLFNYLCASAARTTESIPPENRIPKLVSPVSRDSDELFVVCRVLGIVSTLVRTDSLSSLRNSSPA